MTLKHVLKHFSKTNSEDLLFPRPLREREELLSERSELSNSGEGCISCAKHTETDLSSNRPIVLMTLKKAAFTLAEVLITLGIIGVVAAMTLPTLVQNYKKTVYVNQLKKFVSTFEQGLQKMLADEGVQRLSDLPDLGTGYYTWDFAADAQAVIDDFLSKGFYVAYKDAQGYLLNDWIHNYEDSYTNHMQLNDGSAIIALSSLGKTAYHKTSAQCDLIKSKGGTMCSLFMYFFVDVNGVKGPNKEGRDVFFFFVSDEGKLYPKGGKDNALYDIPSSPLESNLSYWNSSSADEWYGCDGNSKMGGCAARIIENGWKMDY